MKHNRYTNVFFSVKGLTMAHYMETQHRPLAATLASLGQRVEAYRISRNLKQAELAEMSGISRSTLARIEGGKGGTIDSLVRVMRALELEDRLLEIVPDATLSPLDPRSDKGKTRQRVRRPEGEIETEEWTWDDKTP